MHRRIWAREDAVGALKSGRRNGQSVPQHLIDSPEIVKAYKTPLGDFIALNGINLQVDEGVLVR
jgi:hypothetical protein